MDKLYKVADINFSDLTLSASECDMQISDVPTEEIFRLEDFKEFRVTLRNWKGNVVNFAEFIKNRKTKS
ncbi:MAG: hypothetical protein IJA10_12645 [Lachnospiraceae bacterium]|nr:hypothetical protein [Lachnospiraceae bacterium]